MAASAVASLPVERASGRQPSETSGASGHAARPLPSRTTASDRVTATGGVNGTFGREASCGGTAKPGSKRRACSTAQAKTVPSRLDA